MQYRWLRKRAFHWLVKVDRLHRVLHRLELDADLNAVRAISRIGCRVRLPSLHVGRQCLHNLDGTLGAAVAGAGREPGEDSDHRPRGCRQPPCLEASENWFSCAGE
eukprot:UN06671